MAQFIPSSYRQFALDFSKPLDRQINLFDSIEDAVGSIANYLHLHGWKVQRPVARLMQSNLQFVDALWLPYRQPVPLSPVLLMEYGHLKESKEPYVLRLQEETADQYWLVFDNFKVLQTYNTSPLYALTVHLFSQHLKSLRLFGAYETFG